MDEEGDGAPEEVGLRLEVGVKDGDEVALGGVAVLEAVPHGAGFVPVPVVPHLVLDVYPLARPPVAFHLHQILHQIDTVDLSTILKDLFHNIGSGDADTNYGCVCMEMMDDLVNQPW